MIKLFNVIKKLFCMDHNMVRKMQIVLSIIFILFPVSASAQWTTQSPIPTFLDVRGVGSPTDQRVFIATSDNSFDNSGALFESSDGGNSWVQRNIPISLFDPLNGIFFLDSQLGWTYGNDNYRTTDGGTTWIQMPVWGSTYFMEFHSPAFGWATGNFGQMISLNGGVSWSFSPNNIFSFDFIDNQTGLGVSETGVYLTTDGGNSFTLVHAGAGIAVEFLSTTIAAAIADDSFIRSTDGGLTWAPGVSAEGRAHLFALSADIIFAYGRSGTFPNYDDRVFRSTNAGLSWTDLGEIMPEGVLEFTTPDQQRVVASDLAGNMFYSSDAGLNWIQSFNSPGPRPGFFGSNIPVFPNSQTGYFGYGGGFVIKTTNGGADWFQISSGIGQAIYDIGRFPNGNLIAVGEEGTILTSNGTSPWVIYPALTTDDMKAVHVLNQNEVVVLDETGRVYKSSDGGNSWTAAASTPTGLFPAADLNFTTLLDGWVVGTGFSNGAVFHTTDGGDSWIPVTGFGGVYISIDVEGNNLWAANVGGRFYRSTDNGANWIQEDLPASPLQIGDMDFYDETIGYAVSWYGKAFRSDDGGISWQELPTPNDVDKLTDIYLVGPNELWVSSDNNNAYYSGNGGQNWSLMNVGSEGLGIFYAVAANPEGDAWVAGWEGYIEHFSGPPPPPVNLPPVASFEFTPGEGLTVNFTDTSTDPDGIIVSWEWDFGDSTTSTERHPVHTFPAENTYVVRLTVTDDDGDTGSTIRIVVVQHGPGGVFGDFTEVTPLDSVFVTPQDEDFWVITTAPADYDGDGDLDIAVLGFYVVYNLSVDYRLLLLRNDGPVSPTQWGFTYINVPIGELTSGESDLAWGDVDGDGDLDLALGTDGTTVIFRNDAGALILTDTQLPGYYEDNFQAEFDLRSITWADYDNDGDLDLLIPSVFNSSTFSYYTALMRNDGPNGSGGWNFTELDSVFAPTTHAQSAWADFDGDQDLDILLINVDPIYNNGFIRLYKNEGGGVFNGEDLFGNVTVEHGEAQWGDYDGDGDLDILIAGLIIDTNGVYTQVIRIYKNDSGNFSPFEVIACIPCEGWIDISAATWADYDSDGDIDILVAGTYNSGTNIEGRARVYNNTNGVFTDSGNELPAPRASGDRGGTFSWLDIDNDGDLDYFIAGQYFVPGGNGLVEAQMHIYRNDVEGENNAPSAPSDLTAIMQNENTVLLSWTAATDDHTPAAAITYDLDLFRDSLPVSVPIRLPEPGNVSAVNEWQLTGLQEGRYEWRLRAVDNSYIGGSIAGGEFFIGVTSVGPDNLPEVFSLAQNYPNPFNPSTLIKYSIPTEGLVTLKIYNVIGEEVAVLIDEFQKAGNHHAIFDASKLSSAVYLYRLQSGNFVETKKMLLLK